MLDEDEKLFEIEDPRLAEATQRAEQGLRAHQAAMERFHQDSINETWLDRAALPIALAVSAAAIAAMAVAA